ncbi:MAG TPA: hypothetical protein VG370_20165 [Chloroflexota bacterium]|jgi:hypothetical protein|nr:hypothetical protein [Chloroflexota bacterium]
MNPVKPIALLASALVLLACAVPAPSTGPAPDALKDLLFLGTPAGLRTFDTASGRLGYVAHNAVAIPDWQRLVRTATDGHGSRLAVLDARTGAERASFKLPEPLAVAVVSTSGNQAALVEPRAQTANPYQPTGRARTRIVVADLSSGAQRTFDLEGNFEPEAFSTDDRRLFVLEHLPAMKPDRYRVRQLHLDTALFVPMVSRWKQAPLAAEEEMRGTGRTQVLSPDRRTLYTLYVRQPEHLHVRDLVRIQNGGAASTEHVHAFVHVLDLHDGSAFCLDLPMPFGVDTDAAHALAVSADGARLYVAEGGQGALAAVDTGQMKVLQSALLGAGGGALALLAAPNDRLFLADRQGVALVDPARLVVRERWPVGPVTGGLALSPDFQRLYLGLEGRVAVLDAATGHPLADLATSGTLRHVTARA